MSAPWMATTWGWIFMLFGAKRFDVSYCFVLFCDIFRWTSLQILNIACSVYCKPRRDQWTLTWKCSSCFWLPVGWWAWRVSPDQSLPCRQPPPRRQHLSLRHGTGTFGNSIARAEFRLFGSLWLEWLFCDFVIASALVLNLRSMSLARWCRLSRSSRRKIRLTSDARSRTSCIYGIYMHIHVQYIWIFFLQSWHLTALVHTCTYLY